MTGLLRSVILFRAAGLAGQALARGTSQLVRNWGSH